jgi:hypothetical protein
LSTTPKLVHPWQAYQNKFYSTKLKPKVDEAWKEYLNQIPEGQKPGKTLFEIRNHVVQKLYEEETDEVKQEVEEHRKKMKAGKSASGVTERNKELQMYVKFLAKKP